MADTETVPCISYASPPESCIDRAYEPFYDTLIPHQPRELNRFEILLDDPVEG